VPDPDLPTPIAELKKEPHKYRDQTASRTDVFGESTYDDYLCGYYRRLSSLVWVLRTSRHPVKQTPKRLIISFY